MKLRSGVEIPDGVPLIRAQVGLSGPPLPPGSKLVGIRYEPAPTEAPQVAPNVVPFKPRASSKNNPGM